MKAINLLQQTTILGFIGSTILFSPFATHTLTVEEVTNTRRVNGGWVADMADILSDRTETKLNSLITNLEQNNGTEIVVVTVPKTFPANSPKAFATQLFNYWGIGKVEEDNGILFLISTGDRRVEIETGYGIEAILPDAQVGKIINTKITPQFKQGNYDSGTLAGTQALVKTLQNQTDNTNQQSTASPRETNSTKTAQSDRSFGSALLPIVFLNIIFIVGWFYNRKHHRRGAGSKHSTSGIFGSSKKSRRRYSRYSRSSYSSFGK